MYWFLVMHADLGGKRGDLGVVKGRSIGAAPWVDMGLRRLLIEAGIDLARDQVKIAPVPGAQGAGRELRRDRSEGAGGAQDRRFLGQRDGHRGSRSPRRRRGSARREARRWTEAVLQTIPWPRSPRPTG